MNLDISRDPAIDAAIRAARPRPVASNPLLYDIPELQAARDALWKAVCERLPRLKSARRLDRAAAPETTVGALAQVCGYRYATELAEQVSLVATPRYRVKGADGPFLRSVVLVRSTAPAGGLADLRGRTLALETGDLNSQNLLRAEAAPLSLGGRFFGALQPAAGFATAAQSVAEGEADAALLDGVAYALLERFRPALAKRLRVLLWTSRSPGPPFVADRAADPATVATIAAALDAVPAAPAYAALRKDLLIADFMPLPKAQYRAVLHLDQIAESLGYPRLA